MDSFFDSNVSDSSSVEEKISNLTEKIIRNPEDYFSCKEQAKLLLNNYPNTLRAEIALEALEKVLEKEPEDIEANCLAIRALRLKGNLDDALTRAERLKSKFQNTAIIYEELGRIQLKLENYDEALKILELGHEKFCDNERIMRALVLVLMVFRKYHEALTICNILLEKNPRDSISIDNKMEILFFLNQYDDVLNTGERFYEDHPDEYRTINYTTQDNVITFGIQLARHYHKVAIHYLNKDHLSLKSLGNKKSDKKQMLITSNLNLKSKKLFERALFHVDNTISDDSHFNWTRGLFRKSVCLLYLEQYKEALILLDELISDQKNDYSMRRYKIFALFALKRYQEVLKTSEQYLEHAPTSDFIRKLRLSSLINLDKKTEYDNEIKKMEDYRLKQNPQKAEKDIIADDEINFSKNDSKSGRTSIRKVEKDLRNFLRKKFPIEMMHEHAKNTGEKMYERLEEHRLESSKREHKSKGIDDVYSQMTFGDIEHIIISQKKQAKKLKSKIKKVDTEILETHGDEREELETRKAGYIK